jgi:D-alanine-D-alanine ligase
MAASKKKIAVLFGGRSPEHDVSIVTGLQALGAMDPDLFDAFPVYIASNGDWYVGDVLRDRNNYIPGPNEQKQMTRVSLASEGGKAFLSAPASGAFGKPKRFDLDFALLAFHGAYGEDGRLQGLLECFGVPYSGCRTLAAAVFMDKILTKNALANTGIPQLPATRIDRPAQGFLITPQELGAMFPTMQFPCILKPVHLGSSIGVAKVDDWQEVSDTLPAIFKFDTTAILEPFVDNLVEYNISVTRVNGAIETSAIETPKRSTELLDFKTKYLSGGGNKSGTKTPGQSSEGMLSLTRDINPKLPAETEKNIRAWATAAFAALDGRGAPRIDFLCNSATGQVWLNEVNPCPGSLGYFLWEAAEKPILFSRLLELLVEEGLAADRGSRMPADPTPEDARLFKRK